MIKWQIEVREGEEVPSGYGIAYHAWARPVSIAMPIPFNRIVGGWRVFLRWLRFPPWRHAEYRERLLMAKAWEEGYEDGAEDATRPLTSASVSWNPYR